MKRIIKSAFRSFLSDLPIRTRAILMIDALRVCLLHGSDWKKYHPVVFWDQLLENRNTKETPCLLGVFLDAESNELDEIAKKRSISAGRRSKSKK